MALPGAATPPRSARVGPRLKRRAKFKPTLRVEIKLNQYQGDSTARLDGSHVRRQAG
jgi:hypothetical protein